VHIMYAISFIGESSGALGSRLLVWISLFGLVRILSRILISWGRGCG